MGTLLDGIDSPQDLKNLTGDELDRLAQEIRTLLIDYCRRYGGHLGSNLAVVEATIALHRVFDLPHDHLVFDVSHQAYTHKILTGRKQAFTNPERFGSVSGFTSPEESEYDDFVLGHTGTSISLACGLAKTRDLAGGTGNVIALIGDGALSSGPAFEGLNWAAEQGGNLIIVVNDNEMSIAENHGGLYRSLAALRATGGQSERNPFRDLNLDYRYVEEGNSIGPLVQAFSEVKDIDHPVVVHIHTRKGLGLGQGRGEEPGAGVDDPTLPALPAEGQVEANHWQNGIKANSKAANSRKVYGRMAMQALLPRFQNDPGLVVISPATPLSNGIDPEFRSEAGRHYLDVGIAESHAVAFAAGLAKAGGTPVVATSSTFFQRHQWECHHPAELLRRNIRDRCNPLGRQRHRHDELHPRTDLPGARERRRLPPDAGLGHRPRPPSCRHSSARRTHPSLRTCGRTARHPGGSAVHGTRDGSRFQPLRNRH